MTEPREDDPLEALRVRVEAARAAAEALAAEAAAAREQAGRAGDVPGAGTAATAEVHALAALLQAVRTAIPEDLWAQLADIVRSLLLFVRAVLDWWIERLGTRPPRPPAVHDVPIG